MNISEIAFLIDIPNDYNAFIYKIVVFCLTTPLFLLTVSGNGIILITILSQARLLSSICNYFILSLAFADFFVGILVMPLMILFTANRHKWAYSQTVCDFWMSFDFLCSSASFLTLSVMSIERYKMLTTSYVHIKNGSKKRILSFICLSWLLPFMTWIPVIIGFRSFYGANQNTGCSVPANKYLVLGLSVFLYHIPLICMVTFYTKLIIHIKDTSSLNTPQNKQQQAANNHNENLEYELKYQQKERHSKYFKAIKLKRDNQINSYSNSYIDNFMKERNYSHESHPLKSSSYKSKCINNNENSFDNSVGNTMRNIKILETKIFENSAYQKLRIKRNRKAARMLGFLVAAFSICWLPYTIFYPLSQFFPNLGKLI